MVSPSNGNFSKRGFSSHDNDSGFIDMLGTGMQLPNARWRTVFTLWVWSLHVDTTLAKNNVENRAQLIKHGRLAMALARRSIGESELQYNFYQRH